MNEKRYGIVLSAIFMILLMISSATALPTVNGKLTTDYLENYVIEQKEYFINQLITIYDQLKKDGVISTENQELQNIDITQDLNQYYNIDIDGFTNYIISNEFIQLLNEHYYDIVNNNGIQLLWNTEYMQEYVQSDAFINFMNTDEVQYILDNLDPQPIDQQVLQTQVTNVNSQVLQTESGQENLLNDISQTLLPIGQTILYNTQSDETLEVSATSSSEEALPTVDLITVWVIILIGILTWPVGIFVVLICAPILAITEWVLTMLELLSYGIWPFPILLAIVALISAILYIIIGCACWPVIWPELLALLAAL